MKKRFHIFGMILCSLVGGAFAAPAKPAVDTVTPVATPEKRPRWVPGPAPEPDSRKFSYSVNGVYSDDYFGYQAYSYLDLGVQRRLDEYSVTADGKIRFGKGFSSTDDTDSLRLLSARVTYLESFLQVSAGRLELGDVLTPAEYFGSYPTMGIHRVDGGMAVLPIRFSFGVEDYKSVSAPPTALSLMYFPSLFSAYQAKLDSSQALFLAQLRVKAKIKGVPTTFRITGGGSKTNYFDYSSINGNLTYSASADFTFAGDYNFYLEYGVQNSKQASKTNGLTVGARAQHIYTIGPLSLDEVITEMQMPLADSTENPFVAGNGFIPALAVKAEKVYFVKLKARLKAVFLEAALTNAVGDYTFARLNALNTKAPVALPFGTGNEIKSLSLPFQSKEYARRSYLVRIGVDF